MHSLRHIRERVAPFELACQACRLMSQSAIEGGKAYGHWPFLDANAR
jgi:hypothetical protein